MKEFNPTPTDKLVCIWHANCTDGFGAAYVVRKRFGEENVEFIASSYDDPAPCDHKLEGRDVLIVDFSFKQDTMRHIISVARSVTILDHHKTARDAIEPLLTDGLADGIFDMTKSGALLTWEWLFPDTSAPALIEHISDRDLWEFKLPYSREIIEAVYSYPMEFDTWDALFAMEAHILIGQGQALLRAKRQQIETHLASSQFKISIEDHTVPCAAMPYSWASEAGQIMSKDQPFSATVVIKGLAAKFSLRSQGKDAVDVSAIAHMYGGGGHANAAGFTVDLDSYATMVELGALDI